MSAVIDYAGNTIELVICRCGSEPDYHSANGLAHEIICPSCGRQTDMEMCGLDAVYQWNHGRTYASAATAPIRSTRRIRRKE